MTKTQALETINEGLKEILRESYDWCDSADVNSSSTAIRINQKAHDLQLLIERYQSGYFEE